MKHILAVAAASLAASGNAVMAQQTEGAAGGGRASAVTAPVSIADVGAVSPALAAFIQGRLQGEVWQRPQMRARDRSVVTVAVLVARNQPAEMPAQFALALDHGLKPAELSEIILHLAFYTGLGNALAAIPAARQVFVARGIDVDALPAASGDRLPLNEAAEAARAAGVQQNFGVVAPGVVQYTTDVLFRDLWLRPALVPRDRSLVTVAALVATGQVAQIPYHLNRAMDNGLTQAEASELLTQLAFYSGWPSVFSAMPVFKDVFAKRAG
ncbi:carboxymuconolactone decarboxylase family protein [Cupriavidus sp. D384]|uniref:carboxymuconolactone decarboxylase family protein n=1 Tax=Cupriavidus sp. D384 TaxID=1538095 RepID=UPI000830E4FE|nr:carboxymuconolactone decarboxylase family protein [Cupriavidus sp. D384]